MRARNFHNNLGRWGSQDPIGFDGGDFNLYRYVNNRFVVMIDPSGLHDQACYHRTNQKYRAKLMLYTNGQNDEPVISVSDKQDYGEYGKCDARVCTYLCSHEKAVHMQLSQKPAGGKTGQYLQTAMFCSKEDVVGGGCPKFELDAFAVFKDMLDAFTLPEPFNTIKGIGSAFMNIKVRSDTTGCKTYNYVTTYYGGPQPFTIQGKYNGKNENFAHWYYERDLIWSWQEWECHVKDIIPIIKDSWFPPRP